MGRIASVVEFLKNKIGDITVAEIKGDLGKEDIFTGSLFQGAGCDSAPLAGDFMITHGIPETGGSSVVGFIDPKNEPKAEGGEKRIYSRKEDGSLAAEFHLKKDGSVDLKTEKSTIEIGSDGAISISNEGAINLSNGSGNIEIASDGAISVSNSSSISITNGTGAVEVGADGSIDLNGVTVDAAGIVQGTIINCTALTASGAVSAGTVATGGLGASGGGALACTSPIQVDTITASSVIATSDVVAGSTSLKAHTHTNGNNGSPTGTPI